MEIKTYFFDTYAFFEIITGNENYSPYTTSVAIVTSKLNLMELFYGLLIKYDLITANKYYNDLVKFAVDIDDDTIKNAMIFRAKVRNKGLSYVDCIGYILSNQRKIKFLTGDEQFKGFPNVEFVK